MIDTIDASEEIARLRARIRTLQQLLAPFRAYGKLLADVEYIDDSASLRVDNGAIGNGPSVGDLRRVFRAMKGL